MAFTRNRLAVLLAAVLLATSFGPAVHAAGISLPDADPFYAQPGGLAKASPGQVLAYRTVTTVAYALPIPTRTWQIKYRSIDNLGKPTANVTTLLVPNTPWTGPGSRPLVSYQTPEDGAGTQCAPSYGLRVGILAGYGNLDSGIIALTLAKGWAVVVPDYEGPDSQFLSRTAEARGVLDSLKAVRNFAPAGLGKSPIGITGYSGGAVASTFAAQLQKKYAPELPIRGYAIGGTVAGFRTTAKQFLALGLTGVFAMAVAAIDRGNPSGRVYSYLNAKGRALVKRVARDCIVQAATQQTGASLNKFTTAPNILDNPTVVDFLRRLSPLAGGGAPAAPVFMYDAVGDELAPIKPARELFRKFCNAGVRAQMVENPIGEHGTEAVLGYPRALAFLADRFAGRPAPTNC